MDKKKKLKIRLTKNKIILPLHFSQGGIRIADKDGVHRQKPTKSNNEKKYSIEWMITNDEIKLLSNHLLNNTNNLINEMKKIENFAEDSKYAQRKTKKEGKKKIASFKGFKIYKYKEVFHSFEKNISSGIKVRLTFKLGDFGITAHPHMYVLIPFDYRLLLLKNKLGIVNVGDGLGSGCFGELTLNANELKDIVLTLAHASNKHRDDLVKKLKS